MSAILKRVGEHLIDDASAFRENGYVFHKLARPAVAECVITTLRERFGADAHFMRLEPNPARTLQAVGARLYYRPEAMWIRDLVRCLANIEGSPEQCGMVAARVCVTPGLQALETTYILGGWDKVQTIIDQTLKDRIHERGWTW